MGTLEARGRQPTIKIVGLVACLPLLGRGDDDIGLIVERSRARTGARNRSDCSTGKCDTVIEKSALPNTAHFRRQGDRCGVHFYWAGDSETEK